jgi:hypothetical protein
LSLGKISENVRIILMKFGRIDHKLEFFEKIQLPFLSKSS